MPIRFRCPECHQLLGIARRKAGTYVSCPTCHRDTLVPFEDQLPLELPPAEALPDVAVPPPAPAPPPALFERDDFEDILQGAVPHPETSRSRGSAVRTPVPAARPQPPVGRWAAPAEASQSGGLVLSPKRATALTVVVILLLALAFALGLIVGRFVL